MLRYRRSVYPRNIHGAPTSAGTTRAMSDAVMRATVACGNHVSRRGYVSAGYSWEWATDAKSEARMTEGERPSGSARGRKSERATADEVVRGLKLTRVVPSTRGGDKTRNANARGIEYSVECPVNAGWSAARNVRQREKTAGHERGSRHPRSARGVR